MSKNLFLVEVNNGYVVLIGFEPLLISRRSDVHRLEFKRDLCLHPSDDKQGPVAEAAFRFGKEGYALQGRHPIFLMLPISLDKRMWFLREIAGDFKQRLPVSAH